MNDSTMCRIPVKAVIEVSHGQAVMVSAEYEDIPADLIAKYIVEHWKGAPIPGVQDV